MTGIAGTSRVTGVRYSVGGNRASIETNAMLLATGIMPNSGIVNGIERGRAGRSW